MFCQIKDRATPVTLGQMRAGELFLVEGVRELQHCVFAVSVMEKVPADFGTDNFISVVVVACAKPPQTAGYAPAGYEVDLARDIRVTRVEQTQIALFSAKPSAFENEDFRRALKETMYGTDVAGGLAVCSVLNIGGEESATLSKL
jgi:hypothetical protein